MSNLSELYQNFTPSSTDTLTNKSIDADNNTITNLTASALKTGDVLTMKKVARVVFDYSDQATTGNYDTGVTIPDNAIITKMFYDVITTFAGDGDDSTTISIDVEGADDMVASIAISDGTDPWDAGIHEGIPKTEDSSTWVKTTQARNVTVSVTVNASDTTLSAGSMVMFFEYVISQ